MTKKNKRIKTKKPAQIVAKVEPTKIEIAKMEYDRLQSEIKTFILGSGLKGKLSETQVDLCIKTAQSFGLNPLKREIHFVPREIRKNINGQWQKTGEYDVTVIIGYETYLKRAEATGRLDGWETKIEPAGNDTKCTITIHKKGWAQPFSHEVFLTEARQDNSPVWKQMPKFQLKKVAISQGFRLAFPEEMAGLPYIPEEIGVGSLDGDKLAIEEKKPQIELATAEQKAEILVLAKQAAGWEKEQVTKFIMDKFKLKSANEFTSPQAIALISGLKKRVEENKKKEIIVDPIPQEPEEENSVSQDPEDPQFNITDAMIEEGIDPSAHGPIEEGDSPELQRVKKFNNSKIIGAK
jgi:phage recombination protein Bet